MDRMEQLEQAVAFVQQKMSYRPKLGLILGSGLGDYGDTLSQAVTVPYGEIPFFPVSTVEGHKGQFVITPDVICMQGRFHYYEGYDMEDVVMPVRLMARLGVKTVVLTNAAGGVNPDFAEGTLMLITDHINFMGQNPLRGKNWENLGPRFPDMSFCYTPALRSLAKEVAQELGISLKEGIYCGFSGPSYETPAEVRMARILGADAVGMSTVPEAIVAAHAGLQVLGISCITNPAAGVSDKALSHEEVIAVTKRVKADFVHLVDGICAALCQQKN